MLVSLRVGNILYFKYAPWPSREKPTLISDLTKLNKKDTYTIIFSPNQSDLLASFHKLSGIKILYESVKAVNKVTGHGMDPRNTLIIFELKSSSKKTKGSSEDK